MHYHPNVLLLSGIAWDHSNVFPSFESYFQAFHNLLASLPSSTAVVYCAEDERLSKLIQSFNGKFSAHPYTSAEYVVREAAFHLLSQGRELPLKIFGPHNMQNLAGAREVCRLLNIPGEVFERAMQHFPGAHKRLQGLAGNAQIEVYQDFAHAPSKARASVNAVKALWPERPLVACLELHTYSSLNPNFLPEYRNTMDAADEVIVFVHPEAIKSRGDGVTPEIIESAFAHDAFRIFFDQEQMSKHLKAIALPSYSLLLMSSGNWGGMDLSQLATFAASSKKNN